MYELDMGIRIYFRIIQGNNFWKIDSIKFKKYALDFDMNENNKITVIKNLNIYVALTMQKVEFLNVKLDTKLVWAEKIIIMKIQR